MAGLRMEATHIKYNGWNWNVADDKDETETLEPTGNHKNSYVNWLPSLLFKYDVNDDLKLRTSFTETLSRPKYSALIPCVNINRSDNELVMGNSDLTPDHLLQPRPQRRLLLQKCRSDQRRYFLQKDQ